MKPLTLLSDIYLLGDSVTVKMLLIKLNGLTE